MAIFLAKCNGKIRIIGSRALTALREMALSISFTPTQNPSELHQRVLRVNIQRVHKVIVRLAGGKVNLILQNQGIVVILMNKHGIS